MSIVLMLNAVLVSNVTLIIIMESIITLNVIMLSVVKLNVVAPDHLYCINFY
jgi:hypothetical protein